MYNVDGNSNALRALGVGNNNRNVEHKTNSLRESDDDISLFTKYGNDSKAAEYRPLRPGGEENTYNYYKDREDARFIINEIDTGRLIIDSALEESDPEALKEKSGEELFEIFDKFENEYGENDFNHMRTNAALIKLLGSASREQIEDFMNEYKEAHGEDGLKALGDSLMWVKCAGSMVTDEEYDKFMSTMQNNSDLIPSSSSGLSVGNGFFWL